ncbi:Fusaric acid resistance protein-like-domain-containing protein [Blakeslea trispora]|nr:Fusaric acid resistance protein-like-domain-containing protein [Blakeslea trispora]
MSDPSPETKTTPSGLSILFQSRPPNVYRETELSSPTIGLDDSLFYTPMSTTVSLSSYFDNSSTYDVILDDGSRQKRTISLTTVPSGYLPDLHTESIDTSPLLIEKKAKSWQEPYFHPWTAQQKMVFKCSLAYTIGSLFTFVPFLNALCGTHVNSHLAATVIIFFNPAKTVGGMIESAGIAWIYTLAALALSLGSMYTTDYFLEHQMPWTAYTISLGFWLAIGIFTISYLKVKYNKPSVLAASGLACIILIIVIVRQGSGNEAKFNMDIILETCVIVAIGSFISFAVCVLVWPMTATRKLKTNMDSNLSSMRTMLKLLTKTFLLDQDTSDTNLESTYKHNTSFTTLRPVLKEAQLEFYCLEMMRHSQGYACVIESLERLAQHMNGLKSSCGLQGDLKGAQKATHYGTMQSSLSTPSKSTESHEGQENTTSFRKEQEESAQLIRSIRSPIKSLAYTCKQTMLHLQAYITQDPTEKPSLYLLRQNLTSAIDLFEVSQNQALLRFYQKRFSSQADNHHLHSLFMTQTDVPMNEVYRVYFFVFCLLELAKELLVLLECVQYISEDMKECHSNGSLSSWIQTLFNKKKHDTYPFHKKKTLYTPSFIPNNRNTLDTLHTPLPKTRIRRLFVHLWDFFCQLGTYRVKFAIKSMVTVQLVSILAFIPATRPYFTSFKLEWTVITVMAVMSPTVGATNQSAALRILATMVGCSLAALVYTIFGDHTWMLWCITWIVSFFSFWMILYHKHGRFGFFGLLAYNLIVLYQHNHRNNAIQVIELSWMRCVAVSLGVLIGLIVNTYVWPYEARTQLRRGLSDVLLRFLWLYKQVMLMFSEECVEDSYTLMIDNGYHLQAMELALQMALFELQTLLSHAPNEPRLKGPFPVKAYTDMIACCQRILDTFLTIRVVMLKDVWDSYVRQSFLMPAVKELMEMSGSVLLYFYLLASALQLKTPLPPYFPPAENARYQLMQKLHTMAHLGNQEMTWPDDKRDECYMIYYAYVILMGNIIRELDMVR